MRVFFNRPQLDAALSLPPLEPGAFRFARQYGPAAFVCGDCGEVICIPLGGISTGYGQDWNRPDDFICFACCGARDRAEMESTGKATLYLVREKDGTDYVTNWPGTLKLHANVRVGRHNFARRRYDAWFRYRGELWHGVQIGDNTQIIRCKRTKG